MAFDSGHRVHRSGDVVHRLIQGEAVLLDLASGRYFGLNATGAALWELLYWAMRMGLIGGRSRD